MKNGNSTAETKLSVSSVLNRDFVKLTVPLILQTVLASLVSATDSVMLGRLNQNALSAVTLAGQLTQVFLFLINALCTGSTALTAQYYGKNDGDSVRKVTVITLRFAALCGLLTFVASFVFPEAVMKLFSGDEQLIPLGVSYLRMVSFSFLFMSISQIYLTTMKNTGHAGLSTVFGSVAVILNIALNALLIYGLFGFPAMGIRGAALATVIARAVELALVAIFAFASGRLQPGAFADLFRSHRGLMKKYLRYTTPTIVQMGSWMIASALTMAILGHMDSDIVAASSIALILYNLAASFAHGSYSAAVGITLGHMLGRGEVQKAKRAGDILLRFAVIYGAIMGLILALTGAYALPIFNTLTDAAYRYVRIMIVFMGIKCVGKFFNATLALGIFSSGGDVMYLLKLDLVNMWLIILPLSLIAYLLKLPALAVYAIVNMDEYTKIVLMYRRYRTYSWAKNLTTKDWAPPGRYDRQIRRQIVDEMPLGVMVISNSGHIELTNDACARLLGMDREQLEGGDYRSLFLENDGQWGELSDLLLEAMNDKTRPREAEVTWQANGSSRVLHVWTRFMEDEDCRMGLCLMLSEKDPPALPGTVPA